MGARIFSTVVLWSVVLGSLWLFGAHAAVALIALLTAATLWEFYGMMEKMGQRPFRWMGVILGVLMTAGTYYLALFVQEPDVLASVPSGLLVVGLIASCCRVLGERDAATRVEAIASTTLGLLLVPYMLHFLVRILMRDGASTDNLALCLWIVAVSKFCDVGGLLTGLALGRHKMAPNISPKKTWEGTAGGLLTSMLVGATIAHLAADHLPEALTPLTAALIALPLAVTTVISDLIESAIKRRADIKDAGKLIPGIGGAFDLTDSLILTAPVAYFIFLFVE